MEISLAQPVLDEEAIQEAERVLRDEFFLRGESVEAFEREFAAYVGTDEAIAINSGTEALHLSLRALGVSEGDKVLTTPATFIATANTIVRIGATPVFVDIALDTYTMDQDALERTVDRINDIAAVVPVYLYGYPIDVNNFREILGDVPIVSDACQAHGASYAGRKVGSFADLAAFSFYPSKNITVAGDGGMVTTDDGPLADVIRSLRDVGRENGHNEHTRIGYTARLNTVNAAIGREQLKHLDSWNERRAEIAVRYSSGLSGVGDLVLPPEGNGDITPAWYLYVVRTSRRDDLAFFLADNDIETGVHYQRPVHLHPPYQDMGFEAGMFPNAEQWADEVLSLPMHPHLTNNQVDRIIDTVRDFFDGSGQ